MPDLIADLETTEAVIDAFGGPTKFGDALGISRTHAHAMKTRDSIPPEYWETLVSKAAELGVAGVTYEALAKIAGRKRRAPEAAE